MNSPECVPRSFPHILLPSLEKIILLFVLCSLGHDLGFNEKIILVFLLLLLYTCESTVRQLIEFTLRMFL